MIFKFIQQRPNKSEQICWFISCASSASLLVNCNTFYKDPSFPTGHSSRLSLKSNFHYRSFIESRVKQLRYLFEEVYWPKTIWDSALYWISYLILWLLLKLGNVCRCPLGLIDIVRKATDIFWKKKVYDPEQPSWKLKCSNFPVGVCFMKFTVPRKVVLSNHFSVTHW